MAKKTKVEAVEAVEAETSSVETSVASKSVGVYSASGALHRTFSKEDHGAEYKKLAEGYAKKVNGTTR